MANNDIVFNLNELFEKFCEDNGFTIEDKQMLADYINSDEGKADLEKRINEKVDELMFKTITGEG